MGLYGSGAVGWLIKGGGGGSAAATLAIDKSAGVAPYVPPGQIVPGTVVSGSYVVPLGRNTQYWYGRVNYWMTNKRTIETEIAEMKSHGVSGYMIEMAGWRSGDGDIRAPKGSAKYNGFINGITSAYTHLHSLCKQNGLWLFVSIVNDNALETKHNNDEIDQYHYYNDVARDLFNIILTAGGENVIIQPSAELAEYRNTKKHGRIRNTEGPRFQSDVIAKCKELKIPTVNNASGGFPSGTAGCTYKAVHPGHISSSLPPDKGATLVVSDNSPIIEEMNGGTNVDTVNANCKPSKIREWKNRCAGYLVCGYYDFKREKYNKDAIDAMGTGNPIRPETITSA